MSYWIDGQIEQRARIQAEERKKKIKEPAFSVPGKPAKFPKLKKKSSEEENAPPKGIITYLCNLTWLYNLQFFK